MKNIYLLGASGSIGTQVLDCIDDSDEFKLVAFSVNSNIERAIDIIEKYHPEMVCVGNINDANKLSEKYKKESSLKIVHGSEGLNIVATLNKGDDGILINSVVGMVGLAPTIEAIKIKRNILLANKETLVVGGEIINRLKKEYGVSIIPIDSEHSAILQCIEGTNKKDIKRLIITASGGAFRDKERCELVDVTIDDALNHPNWNMGKKITVDCATMVNKGLEVIEAHYLFDIDYDNIDTIIHRESIIHSMVEFNDSSVLACMSHPDMRLPITYAMNYPRKVKNSFSKKLDFNTLSSLSFKKMDFDRFPCLKLAYKVGMMGRIMPVVYNSANEFATKLFIERKIKFLEIEDIIFDSVNYFEKNYYDETKEITLDYIFEIDKNGEYFSYPNVKADKLQKNAFDAHRKNIIEKKVIKNVYVSQGEFYDYVTALQLLLVMEKKE